MRMIQSIYEVEGFDKDKAKTKVDDIFKKYDADKSKALDRQEFKRYIVADPVVSKIFL